MLLNKAKPLPLDLGSAPKGDTIKRQLGQYLDCKTKIAEYKNKKAGIKYPCLTALLRSLTLRLLF